MYKPSEITTYTNYENLFFKTTWQKSKKKLSASLQNEVCIAITFHPLEMNLQYITLL